MLYSVIQIAESTGSSKQNIYKKLQKKELKEHIVKQQGITYIDEIGFNLIKDSYQTNTEDLNGLNAESITKHETTIDSIVSTLDQDMFNLLKNQLKEKDLQLNNQLAAKDLQINNLNERLKQEQELNKNNQILQLRQPQDIKALESHFQDLDTKLEEVKEKMQERKHDQEPKGFLNKLFNKK